MIPALLALATAGSPDFVDVSGVKVSCLENLRGKEGRARVEIVVGSGALMESEEERGVAHLVEHLVVRPLGFDHANAATGWDYTTYFRDLRAADLSTAAIDLTRALIALDVEGRAFELEREIVLNELKEHGSRDTERDPIFGDTILARDAAGSPNSVRRLTPADARRFHLQNYVRENVAVAIRGAVSCERMREALAPELAKIPSGRPVAVPRVLIEEPGRRSVPSSELVQGYYWFDSTPIEPVVMQIVAKHLEQRALEEIRKAKGLTYSPQGVFRQLGYGGRMSLHVTTAGRDRVVSEWFDETIDELRKSKTPKELMRAAIPLVADAIEADAVRSSLAAIRGEEAPLDVLAGLTDESVAKVIAKLVNPRHAFGSGKPSSNITSLVILVLFGVVVLAVIAYAAKQVLRR